MVTPISSRNRQRYPGHLGAGFGRRGLGRREPVPLFVYPDHDGLLTVVVYVVEGVFRWLHRYRSELAPFYLTAVVVVVGAWLHVTNPQWWLLVAVVTVAVVAGLVLVPRRWLGSWDRPVERAYLAVVAAASGVWLTVACAVGPAAGPLRGFAVVGCVVLGVPWWADRRRRAAVQLSRKLERWPEIAELAGLKGVTILRTRIEPWGWLARLALRGGITVRKIADPDTVASLESSLDTRPGAIRVEPDPARASRATLRVIESDPHAEPIPMPDPDTNPDTRFDTNPHRKDGTGRSGRSHRSILDAVELGIFEDAEPVRVFLAYRHVLVGGTTGAGKSGLLNVILAGLSGCRDVELWGVDLKEGMELRPWITCLRRLAVTPTEAVVLLRAGVKELERRARQLAEQGLREWVPTPTKPALVIVIDEYAELSDEARALADSIARRGRAVAVTLLVATQRPTQEVMGKGSAIRSQMDVRLCLRVRERRDVDLILGQGMLRAGWDATALDAPGKFLISSKQPEHANPRRARGYYLTDNNVRHIAKRNTRHNTRDKTPNPADTVPHDSTMSPSPMQTTVFSGSETAQEPPDEPPVVTDPHRDVVDPERALWAALRGAPEHGVTLAELMRACGMGRTWVYERLQSLAQADRIERTYRGRWRGRQT